MSTDPRADAQTASRHRKLGRGLASLMANTRLTPGSVHPMAAVPETAEAALPLSHYQSAKMAERAAEAPVRLPVDRIRPNPHQPRRRFDDSELAELTASIRSEGVLQPILVAEADGQADGSYLLIAGERRLRASKLAGLREIPCVVRRASNEQMLQWALVENIQRSNLNPVERATAYRDFMDRFSVSQQELAERMGEPRSTVANYLRILDLCDFVQELLADGQLSFGHAKVLAALAGQEDRQKQLARRVIEAGLSVRHLEQLVANPEAVIQPPAVGRREGASPKTQHIIDLERQLTRVVGTKVLIRPRRKKHSGRIILEYYTLDDFDRITASLGARLES